MAMQLTAMATATGKHGRIEVARATQSQIRAIFAISKRQGLIPRPLVSERFRVHTEWKTSRSVKPVRSLTT
jgi:hypothetical protein